MQPQDDDIETTADDTMMGEYANYVSVGSTQTEFYLDFFLVVPGDNGEEHTVPVRRLLISPMLMRGLQGALDNEIQTYETTYHIQLPTVEP
jgi:hypothetical protein